MTDQQIEKLKSACVIIGEGLYRAVEALGYAADAFVREAEAKALGIDLGRTLDDEKDDSYAELARHFDEIRAMQELTDYAEEAELIPPPKKIPRPAKYIGPVNKANYTANRPPRRARSNCGAIK